MRFRPGASLGSCLSSVNAKFSESVMWIVYPNDEEDGYEMMFAFV